MKKICITLAVLIIITLTAVVAGTRRDEASAFLRVHIRANSNDAADLSVKYKVRDAAVEFLAPIAAECETKAQAMKAIRAALPDLESACDRVLREEGREYSVRAALDREQFPTRIYEGVTLEEGVYDALVLELGAAKGDNWWCVVYPPLCFTGRETADGAIRYRSKILEIVERFKKKNRKEEI